jgi:hypothetical protein
LDERGEDDPGSDGVDVHSAGRPLDGERPGETLDAPFARRVGDPATAAELQARQRRDVDDRAVTGVDHRGAERLAAAEAAAQIDVDRPVPLAGGELHRGHDQVDAGAVEEH